MDSHLFNAAAKALTGGNILPKTQGSRERISNKIAKYGKGKECCEEESMLHKRSRKKSEEDLRVEKVRGIKGLKEYDGNSTKSSSGTTTFTEEDGDKINGGIAMLGIIDRKLMNKGLLGLKQSDQSKERKIEINGKKKPWNPLSKRNGSQKKKANSTSFEAVLNIHSNPPNRKKLKK